MGVEGAATAAAGAGTRPASGCCLGQPTGSDAWGGASGGAWEEQRWRYMHEGGTFSSVPDSSTTN